MRVVSLFLIVLVALAAGQTRPHVRCRANAVSGGCASLAFPPGEIPAGSTQSLFAAASGLIGPFPFASVGFAKRRNATAGEINLDRLNDDALANFNAYGAGLIWIYRGLGVVCDRDTVSGFQDPAADTRCVDQPTATTDCIYGFVVPEQAQWLPVEASFNERVAKVTVRETRGLYKQECYLRGNTSDPTVTQSGVQLGPANTKCDITIDRIVANGAWNPNAVVVNNNAGVTQCGPDKLRVAIQVFVAAAGASTTPTTSGGTAALALGLATRLKWNTQANCTYQDGSSIMGNVIPSAATVRSDSVSLGSGASRFSVLSRINFMFSCPRSNGASSNLLERVFWDPETDIDAAQVPVSGSSIGVSLMAMVMVALVSIAL